MNEEIGRLEDLEEDARALLIGVYFSTKEKDISYRHLDELELLGDTFGFQTVEKSSFPIKRIESSTYLGKGKIEYLIDYCKENKIDIVVFDEEISPHQQRNLEKSLKITVIDRTELILGVFAKHAKTKESKIQIDLAEFRYQLPRLKRMWTHLSRQRTGGGKGGYLKGEGERQIEIDKRILKRKISKLSKELVEIKKQRELQRSLRKKNNIPTFAIIGYTNAGKSTLLKALTDADVLIEDKLFATLDTTTKKYKLPNGQDILLIDTVGFIRKLPHMLVAAFKSTLEEASLADILLHVVDTTDNDVEEHIDATFQVLKELDADKLPMINCLNKIDEDNTTVINKLKIKLSKTVLISAKTKKGFSTLEEMMEKQIAKLRKIVSLKIPQSYYSLACELMREGKVISCDYEENDILLKIEIPSTLENKVERFII